MWGKGEGDYERKRKGVDGGEGCGCVGAERNRSVVMSGVVG